MRSKLLLSALPLAGVVLVLAGHHHSPSCYPGTRLLALFDSSASAEEKKAAKDKPALSGAWTKKEGQMRIEFSGKDVMKLFPHGDKAEIAFICTYSIDKEGLLKAKITDHEGNAEIKEKAKSRYPAGFEFNFQFKAKGDAATIENLDGKDAEGLKSHLEGEYAKKTD